MMRFKFTVRAENANKVQAYLNSFPDSDITDYQRTFVGNTAFFELIGVKNKDVFESIIQTLKQKDLYPKIIGENKMNKQQEKILVEKVIRPLVRKVLKENNIRSKSNLMSLKEKLGVRKDWHEPDEQGITAKITGNHLDNAGVGPEFVLHLYQNDSKVAEINIANLLAMATGVNDL